MVMRWRSKHKRPKGTARTTGQEQKGISSEINKLQRGCFWLLEPIEWMGYDGVFETVGDSQHPNDSCG